MIRFLVFASFLLMMTIRCLPVQVAGSPSIRWRDCLRQDSKWYGSPEAERIADNLLAFQLRSGAWEKNIEMARLLSASERATLIARTDDRESTIDNGATHQQLVYLARVFNSTKALRFKESFLKGIDYLLKAQYGNGGWPQYYPNMNGYYRHITYNDDAMISVMTLLDEIARGRPEYAFVDDARRKSSRLAVSKGIDCILKTQIRVNGELTAWCAQHDEITLAPAPARTYEKVSLSGSESVGIIRFLMSIPDPNPRVVAAIEAATSWLAKVKITGIKVVEKSDPSSPNGSDRVVVKDPQADPLWARFYEIGTNRPIFCGRDGVIKYSLAEIEHERRNGYAWYVSNARRLLTTELPQWLERRGKRPAP
jgi:PelA/Pel-15E family pectate lyase